MASLRATSLALLPPQEGSALLQALLALEGCALPFLLGGQKALRTLAWRGSHALLAPITGANKVESSGWPEWQL